ncbi:hypothetical protein M433DRAFT_298475 [Acidomyces richmondensis BFW]|nr:MAG: hypothetical protein FE78DRAFT_475323 [Acidomyces sp. 'richmondensis']KYG49495.1 hypothetical protein M433DRAFT_298475 [Acidomyces richmondensis BFW]
MCCPTKHKTGLTKQAFQDNRSCLVSDSRIWGNVEGHEYKHYHLSSTKIHSADLIKRELVCICHNVEMRVFLFVLVDRETDGSAQMPSVAIKEIISTVLIVTGTKGKGCRGICFGGNCHSSLRPSRGNYISAVQPESNSALGTRYNSASNHEDIWHVCAACHQTCLILGSGQSKFYAKALRYKGTSRQCHPSLSEFQTHLFAIIDLRVRFVTDISIVSC